MSTESLLDDVRDLNLSYLLLVQRLINTDREMALFRLKIDEEMADLLSDIPVQDLAKLARCNQLLCRFSLDSAQQLFSLVEPESNDDMRRVHAAILLSGQDATDGESAEAPAARRKTAARRPRAVRTSDQPRQAEA